MTLLFSFIQLLILLYVLFPIKLQQRRGLVSKCKLVTVIIVCVVTVMLLIGLM